MEEKVDLFLSLTIKVSLYDGYLVTLLLLIQDGYQNFMYVKMTIW